MPQDRSLHSQAATARRRSAAQCPHRSRWAKCTGNAHAAFYARLFGVNYSSTKRPPPQWHALAAWHPHVWDSAESYARFVSKVAPLVEATYACGCGILPNARLSRSVAIHVRCSDVPWVRNKDYHLPDPAYWPFVERGQDQQLRSIPEVVPIRPWLVTAIDVALHHPSLRTVVGRGSLSASPPRRVRVG